MEKFVFAVMAFVRDFYMLIPLSFMQKVKEGREKN